MSCTYCKFDPVEVETVWRVQTNAGLIILILGLGLVDNMVAPIARAVASGDFLSDRSSCDSPSTTVKKGLEPLPQIRFARKGTPTELELTKELNDMLQPARLKMHGFCGAQKP